MFSSSSTQHLLEYLPKTAGDKIGFLAGVQDPFYFTMQRGAQAASMLWCKLVAQIPRPGMQLSRPHAGCHGCPRRFELPLPRPG